jgi:calpain-15
VDGCWKLIVVDTRIPCYKKKPAYGSSSDTQEMWVALLEKAFAKIKGSF